MLEAVDILHSSIVVPLNVNGGIVTHCIEMMLPDGRQIELFENGTWKPVEAKQLDDVGFRSFKWGTPKELIKDVESLEMRWETDDVLSYSGSVAGMSARVNFHFFNGALESGMYIFDQEHSRFRDQLQDFYKVSELLSKKYGKPTRDEEWADDFYRDYSRDQKVEWAVAAGFLIMTDSWNVGQTGVALMCKGEDNTIIVCLGYTSNLSRNRQERQDLDGL